MPIAHNPGPMVSAAWIPDRSPEGLECLEQIGRGRLDVTVSSFLDHAPTSGMDTTARRLHEEKLRVLRNAVVRGGSCVDVLDGHPAVVQGPLTHGDGAWPRHVATPNHGVVSFAHDDVRPGYGASLAQHG